MQEFLYTIILLGSIQGVISCCLLFFSKRRLLSNRLLAGIILLLTLPGFHLYFHYKSWYELNQLTCVIHDIIPMVIIMPLGPLIYFYVRSLSEPHFALTKKMNWHFWPVVIDLIPKMIAMVLYVSILIGKPLGMQEDYTQFDDWYNKYADIPRWISVTVYLGVAVRWLQQGNNPSAARKIQRWLRLFTGIFLCFQLIWLFYLVPYILPKYSEELLKTVAWFPLYIPMTVLVYWLGIQGFLTSLQLPVQKKEMNSAALQDGWQRLLEAMEHEQLYLDPALGIDKLAAHTGLSARQISELLNQYQAMNFNRFINQYRVEAFKKRLLSGGSDQYTMSGLALECGFNSAATFQRTFKQFTGLAPSAYLKQQKND